MTAPFQPFRFSLEVITPVHIGDAKENAYQQGEDYYYSQDEKAYVFFNKTALYKKLDASLEVYVRQLLKRDVKELNQTAERLCHSHPELILRKVKCPYRSNEVVKAYSTGLGKPVIPGSSIKGALRSFIGKHLMRQQGQVTFNERTLFGTIDTNFMRLLQVSDVDLDLETQIYPMKIFSGDLDGAFRPDYEGIGKWKNSRIGGHTDTFSERGFETYFETYSVGSKGPLRVGVGTGLKAFLQEKDARRLPPNSNHLQDFLGEGLIQKLRAHQQEYLEKEKAFYVKFPNDDFEIAVQLIDDLIALNNEEDSALLQIGAGSGFHSITGDWKFASHTTTGQATDRRGPIPAIKYKTRKIAFDSKAFFIPGYVLLKRER